MGFTGTSIKLNLTSPSFTGTNLALFASVDNGAKVTITVANSTTQSPIATGLAAGTHQLSLWYRGNDPSQDLWTTPTMAAVVTGFTIDGGASSAAPSLRSKRMIWFGDSVSYGIDVNRSTTSPTGHDATQAPGFAVAQAFDAEIGILGFGSQGYGKTGLGNVPRVYDPSSPSTSSWLNHSSGNSRLSAGLLSPAPDYIVLYHGTADLSSTDGNITAGVQGFLPALRTAAPSAKIFCVIPANRRQILPIVAGFEAALGAKVSLGTVGPVTVYRATNDSSAFLIDLGTTITAGVDALTTGSETYQAIDGIHPDGPTNGRIAALITGAMQLALRGKVIITIEN
jgi:hypothetical protein